MKVKERLNYKLHCLIFPVEIHFDFSKTLASHRQFSLSTSVCPNTGFYRQAIEVLGH